MDEKASVSARNVQIFFTSLLDCAEQVGAAFQAARADRAPFPAARDARRYEQRGGREIVAVGDSLTSRNWTLGGSIGARVIDTWRLPRSQGSTHCPRSAFSTKAKPDPAVQVPTLVRSAAM